MRLQLSSWCVRCSASEGQSTDRVKAEEHDEGEQRYRQGCGRPEQPIPSEGCIGQVRTRICRLPPSANLIIRARDTSLNSPSFIPNTDTDTTVPCNSGRWQSAGFSHQARFLHHHYAGILANSAAPACVASDRREGDNRRAAGGQPVVNPPVAGCGKSRRPAVPRGGALRGAAGFAYCQAVALSN